MELDSRTIEAKLKEFWERGYAVFPNALPGTVIEEARERAERLTTYEADPNGADAKRMQAPLGKKLKAVREGAKTFVRSLGMRWRPSHWLAIKSEPGAAGEIPHCDYPEFLISRTRQTYRDTILASMIVGLQAGNSLDVFESCFLVADERKRKRLVFGPGDVVIVKGDLVHSGVSQTEPDIQLSCLLLHKDVIWAQNSTTTALINSFKCRFCPYLATDRKKVNNHMRMCEGNPDREKIKQQFRAYNNKHVTCEKCGQAFAILNSYYQHKKRKHTDPSKSPKKRTKKQ
jgi:hypothetical protein